MEAIATGKKIKVGTAVLAAGLAILALSKLRQAGGTPPPPPPPPPPPEAPTTPPFGMVLQGTYTGSASIYRVQYDEKFPRYGVRIRHTSGSNLSLICFLVQPGGIIEAIRAYTNVPSGTLKEFSFTANLTIPDQVGTWTAYLYGTTDNTITNTNYAGKTVGSIVQDMQEIP